MVIIPNNFPARFRRIVRIACDWPNLLGGLSAVAAIASITRVFFGGFYTGAPVPVALYCLVILLILLVVYFCRGVLLLRRRVRRSETIYIGFHNIAESLRELMWAATNTVDCLSGGRTQAGSRTWAERYIDDFKRECKDICRELWGAFRELGYNIKGVCIKYYNANTHKLHVIERAGRRGQSAELDRQESETENPFFKLLREVHTDYDKHIHHAEAQKIPRNQLIGPPRFLAIGDMRSDDLPKIFGSIMASYATNFKKSPPEGFEEGRILGALRDRSKGYDSCLGMMICKKHWDLNGENEAEVERIMGFIGMDSPDKRAWDFLDPHHMHIVAAVADALYPLMEVYERVLMGCFEAQPEDHKGGEGNW